MSGFLTIFDLNLLRLIWQAAFALMGVSILIVLCLAYRRSAENQAKARRDAIIQKYRINLAELIGARALPHPSTRPRISAAELPALIESCLQYFRNLTGDDKEHLVRILEIWNVETAILNILNSGRRGYKIRALSLLSFLRSDTSIGALEDALDDPDPYIKLSTIRCLARRDSRISLPKILETLSQLEWQTATPMADAFQRFDVEIIPDLEAVVSSSEPPMLRLAALQALAYLKPVSTELNLSSCLKDPNEDIRAAAVTLAGFVSSQSGEDVVAIGLRDSSPVVRIRAVKALMVNQRIDLLAQLHDCLEDTNWWVRYWAGHAIYNLGESGIEILKCIGRQKSQSSQFVRSALAEFEAA